jgi:hypothetical protein
MLLGITSFGSVWRLRFGREPGDPERFRRAAYFNTTGVHVNDRVVCHRKIAGHVRFNGVGGFHPYYIERMIGSVFECEAPCIWNGQNKCFAGRRREHPEPPDYFLVALRSSEFGSLCVGEDGWKSERCRLISFSKWRDQDEALLLIPPDGWVLTGIGRVVLEPDPVRPWVRRPTIKE